MPTMTNGVLAAALCSHAVNEGTHVPRQRVIARPWVRLPGPASGRTPRASPSAPSERRDRDGKGALLRREGLYTSLISEWRKQRDQGALQALAAAPGRPAADSRDQEVARLRRENARLQADLAKAQGDRGPRKTLRAAGAAHHGQRGVTERRRAEVMIDQTIDDLAGTLGKRAACAALGRSRASYYRRHRRSPPPPRPRRAPAPQPRALSAVERADVLGVLHHERFVDQAPASVHATLLDEGRYLSSVPTMY